MKYFFSNTQRNKGLFDTPQSMKECTFRPKLSQLNEEENNFSDQYREKLKQPVRGDITLGT